MWITVIGRGRVGGRLAQVLGTPGRPIADPALNR